MNPPQVYSGQDRRHNDRRIDDLEARFKKVVEKIDDNAHFRSKVERALFDEEDNSRIRIMEEENERFHLKVDRALFDDKGESRIAIMDGNVAKLLQFWDRGKFLGYLLVTAWIGLGSLIGAIVNAWWNRHGG